MVLIFTHQFQVDYIYRYTSRDLGIGYLLSAFWAGQEGSFLLWTLMGAIMGVAFMRNARNIEAYTMLFLNIFQAAFYFITYKSQPLTLQQTIPLDGHPSAHTIFRRCINLHSICNCTGFCLLLYHGRRN